MGFVNQLNKGFTLIELIVVIVLLGILAATALPKYIDLENNAHNEVTRATMGAFKSGVQMLRLKWLANGQPSTLIVNGSVVNFTSEGWVENLLMTQLAVSFYGNKSLNLLPV